MSHISSIQSHAKSNKHIENVKKIALISNKKSNEDFSLFSSTETKSKVSALKMVMLFIVMPNDSIQFADNICESAANIYSDSALAKKVKCRRTKATFILNAV